MSSALREDFRTLAELQEDVDGVLRQVRRTGRPVVVTKKGRPNFVILDVETYEKRMQTLRLGHLLAQAQAEIQAGKGQPLEDVLAEFNREQEVSRHRRAKRQARCAGLSQLHCARQAEGGRSLAPQDRQAHAVLALHAMSLRAHPGSGRLGFDFRHIIAGNYRIIFEVRPNEVHVLRVVHAARVLSRRYFS